MSFLNQSEKERMKNMTTKILFAVITGMILLGICIWSYRLSNVDNTEDGQAEEKKEGGKA